MESHHSTSGSNSASLAKITGPVELLSSSWNFFKTHWKILVPIAVLPTVITFIGNIFIAYTINPLTIVINVIFSILGGILSIVMIPALLTTIHTIKTEHGVSLPLKETYRRNFKFFWGFVLIGIVNAFVGLGAVVSFVVPAIIVGVYTSLYTYTFVIEGKKGFSAFTESYSLVYGRWLPVLGRILFLGLAVLILWTILGFIFGLIASFFGVSAGMFGSMKSEISTMTPSIFSGLMNIVGMAIYLPVGMLYTYQMFTSLKTHRIHNVSISAFKKWLVAFLVIGIIAVPLIIGGSIAAVSFFGDKIKAPLSQNNQIQQQIQQSIEKALMEQNTPEATELLNKLRQNIESAQQGAPSNISK